MARIQILELPDEERPDGKFVTPFAVIIDRCSHAEMGGLLGDALANFRDACGARAGLITAETIDIPGLTPEEMAAYGPRTTIGTVSVKVEPDLTGFEDGVREAIERAQAAIVDAVKDPCLAEHFLDGAILRCQRAFNHDGIHEGRIKDYSYLRWSYAGRRVLPLE